jgi:hypothetical protein
MLTKLGLAVLLGTIATTALASPASACEHEGQPTVAVYGGGGYAYGNPDGDGEYWRRMERERYERWRRARWQRWHEGRYGWPRYRNW